MRAAFTVALIFLPAKPQEVFYEKKIFTCNFDRNGGMLPCLGAFRMHKGCRIRAPRHNRFRRLHYGNRACNSNSVTLIEVRALLNTSALTEITYNGTMAEWKAVQKESGWKTTDNIITDLTIRCTDGVLEYIR